MLRALSPDFPLTGLEDFLRASLFDAPATDPDNTELEIIGPFPMYAGAARRIAAGDWSDIEHVGWRALGRVNDAPAAVIDISQDDGAPRYGLRGETAATVFEAALQIATEYDDAEQTYDVKLLSIPEVYVTAVWLQGRPSVFVPTRLGEAVRSGTQPINAQTLEHIVANLVRLADTPAHETGPEAAALTATPDSKSGPAD